MPTPLLRRWTGTAVLATLVLAGCDTSTPTVDAPPAAPAQPDTFEAPTDPAFAALVHALGHDGITTLLDSEDEDAIAAAFAPYGIGYEVVDVTAAEAAMEQGDPDDARLGTTITECPQYFGTSYRSKWFTLKGAGGSESHYVDGSGRPGAAYKRLPPDVAAPRSTSCQTDIGNWASPASSYDGGHLIGSQLGGWGKRANIVPQHYNFNRGNWKRIEDRLAQCDALPYAAIEYYVIVDYPNASTLTPNYFHSYVNVSGSGYVGGHFNNASGGGSNGRAESDRVINHLISRGC
jgi:hypothetical protein